VLGATAILLTSRSKLQLSIWSLLASTLTLLFVYAGVIRGTLDHSAIVLTLWIAVLIVLVICRKYRYPQQGARRVAFVGLSLVLIYWIGLAFLHHRAVDNASVQAKILATSNGEKVIRLAAMPTLSNPMHWLCVVESDRSFYRFELFLIDRSTQAHNIARFAKPDEKEARVIAQAERDRRAQILLAFARFPVSRVVDQDCLTETLVQLADLPYTEPGQSRGNFSSELPVECPHQP
jgi:hypothetical protein